MNIKPNYPQFITSLFSGQSNHPNLMTSDEFLKKIQEEQRQRQQEQERQQQSSYNKSLQDQLKKNKVTPSTGTAPSGATQAYGQGQGVYPVSAATPAVSYSAPASTYAASDMGASSMTGFTPAASSGTSAYGSGTGMYPVGGSTSGGATSAGGGMGGGAGTMAGWLALGALLQEPTREKGWHDWNDVSPFEARGMRNDMKHSGFDKNIDRELPGMGNVTKDIVDPGYATTHPGSTFQDFRKSVGYGWHEFQNKTGINSKSLDIPMLRDYGHQLNPLTLFNNQISSASDLGKQGFKSLKSLFKF